MIGAAPESVPTKIAEDTVLDALVNVPIELPSEQQGHTKRHLSSRTTKSSDEAQ